MISSLLEYDTDSYGNPLPAGFRQRRPGPPPALSEADRVKNLASAKTALQQVATAMDEITVHRAAAEKIQGEKEALAETCEKACATLRQQLTDVQQRIDEQRPTGRPLSPKLLERRDELLAEINKHTDELYWKVVECDERLAPVEAELRRLRSVIAQGNQARADLVKFAEPNIAARLHVATSAVRWAEARLLKANAQPATIPTHLASAEVSAAQVAVDAAQSESQAAFAAALQV